MQNISLNVSPEQLEQLLKAVAVTSLLYGPLGDFIDSEYKEESESLDTLEALLCQQGSAAGMKNIPFETDDGKLRLAMESEWFDCIWDDIHTYDSYILETELANELAWRDFKNENSQEKIDEMAKVNLGYFGAELYDYEKKYWDEFEGHGFDRLEIHTSTNR